MDTSEVVADTTLEAENATSVFGRAGDQRLGLGVLIAIVSSALGGTAAAVTRYLVGDADPLRLPILRWGIGFLCVLPVALLLRVRWPQRRDWPAVAALGICFFGLFFILYNIAVSYTTAARASLALSTLPLQTMLVGARARRRAADPAQVGRRRRLPCSACLPRLRPVFRRLRPAPGAVN